MRFSWFRKGVSSSRQSPDASSVTSPATVDLVIAQGHVLEDEGRPAEAAALYQGALRYAEDPRLHLNLGNAFGQMGRYLEARTQYETALGLNPGYVQALVNIGNDDLRRDRFAEAARYYRHAVKLDDQCVVAWVGLGCALELNDRHGAIEAYQTALALEPSHGAVACNLFDLYLADGDVAAMRQIVEASLAAGSDAHALRQRLATLERALGNSTDSLNILREMADRFPGNAVLSGLYLFDLLYQPDITGQELLVEHQRLSGAIEAAILPLKFVRPDAQDRHRRLRIGYLSPDFRNHPVTNFILPVLAGHDREQYEVYCYYLFPESDDSTRECRAVADHWFEVADLDAPRLAQRIREDRIDILVDLAGYTDRHRIPVFAYRPAPMQISWLGSLATTGLSRMDFRICDAQTDPVGVAEAWHTERLIRLPNTLWCYSCQTPVVATPDLPYARNGCWTFGSFNDGKKLNASVLAAWAALLRAVPESRIRLYGIQNPVLCAWVSDKFAAYGLAADRVEIFGRIGRDLYYQAFSEIDVALDTFPYSGATTTCDALLMGVPVLTVAGQRSISRSSLSLLTCLGLKEWIAERADTLPKVALAQFEEPDRVAQLRQQLPDRLRNSAIMDRAGFVRDLEYAYRGAWAQLCDAPP